MRPWAEDRLLAVLVERGAVHVADLETPNPNRRDERTLDPAESRWGARLTALLGAERVAERDLERLYAELDIESVDPRAVSPDDPFEIVRPLGAGGMGEVFLARDRRLRRLVALKLLSGRDRQRFAREAQAQSRVAHDGICQIFDVGERYGRAYIAMR